MFAIGRLPSRIGNGKETECSQQIVFDKALCLHVFIHDALVCLKYPPL